MRLAFARTAPVLMASTTPGGQRHASRQQNPSPFTGTVA
jgi:hypothetical protein